MRRYRMFGLLIAAAVAVFVAPTAAYAEPYPAEPPASTISDGTVSDGGTVTFTGQGYLPFEEIEINISYGESDSTAALEEGSTGRFVLAAAAILPQRVTIHVTATAEGTFSIEIPLSEVGTATLTAVGLESGVTQTQVVTVVTPTDSGGGGNDDGTDDGDDTTAGGGTTLPTTGMSGNRLAFGLFGGLGAILLGSALLFVAKARRRRTDTL